MQRRLAFPGYDAVRPIHSSIDTVDLVDGCSGDVATFGHLAYIGRDQVGENLQLGTNRLGERVVRPFQNFRE
jgi:hypothetical protein